MSSIGLFSLGGSAARREDMMRFRASSLLLYSIPAVSFLLSPTPLLVQVHRRATADVWPAIFNSQLGRGPLQRRDIFHAFGGAPASRAKTGARLRSQMRGFIRASPPPEEMAALISNDGVSYLQNPDTGSEIWLVGVVHGKEASVELLESVVRKIRPQVVMLELDTDRLDDLPRGETQKAEDGLCWFLPEEQPDKAFADAADVESCGDDVWLFPGKTNQGPLSFVSTPARLIKGAMDAIVDILNEEGMSEMESAVREAQACGARVLLGDRDFEETKLQLVAAGLAGSVDDERLDDPEALLHDSMPISNKMKFASLDLRRPETRDTAREYYAALEQLCDRRALDAMIPERNEVMARNLMTLKGEHTTVAVVGIFHVDGVERILMDNGWESGLV